MPRQTLIEFNEAYQLLLFVAQPTSDCNQLIALYTNKQNHKLKVNTKIIQTLRTHPTRTSKGIPHCPV